MVALENRVRQLREALGYLHDPDQDDQLQTLIEQWRTAGRDVVERLFSLAPKPDDADDPPGRGGGPSSTSHPWSGEGMMTHTLTEEQREYLAKAPTNADGDPVDHEGNPLLPEMMGDDELRRVIAAEADGAVKRHGKMAYIPGHSDS